MQQAAPRCVVAGAMLLRGKDLAHRREHRGWRRRWLLQQLHDTMVYYVYYVY
jgi:hypothetical protein